MPFWRQSKNKLDRHIHKLGHNLGKHTHTKKSLSTFQRNVKHSFKGQKTRRCGDLGGVAPLPLDRPPRVRISARGLPTVWSEGRQPADQTEILYK